MLYIKFETDKFTYEVEEIIKLFYEPQNIFQIETEPPLINGGIFLIFRLNADQVYEVEARFDGRCEISSVSFKDSTSIGCDHNTQKKLKREIKRCVYTILSSITGKKLPWGILTGIRPAKIVHELIESGMQKAEIMCKLNDYFMVTPKKSELLISTAISERKILASAGPDTASIYIGIPFCKSRCVYCSFTSNSIDKCRHTVPDYFSALKKEISFVSEFIGSRKIQIQSIYIGGGTPTSVDSLYLEDLIRDIEEKFDFSRVQEFTLEAGRPDTIDFDKLKIIKNSKVNRISINPQSMNDETLNAIGRNHSSADIIEAYRLARNMGFDNINMDVIAGLPGEDMSMFKKTLSDIADLGPDSLTVHTLAIKRASKLKEENQYDKISSEVNIEGMLDLAEIYAFKMGMHPYYLYRQKNMLENLENVGYCRPGAESVYNVQIMEEKQSIIALGAGAITKVVYPSQNIIERAFNVKNHEEYIKRINEMIDRKRILLETL